MITSNKVIRPLASLIALMVGLSLMFLIVACSNAGGFPDSPDGRYKAIMLDDGSGYQVVETKTDSVVLTTTAQYSTYNDVKTGGFSPDSKKFAAVYHYGHEGSYSWIGVWSTETGELLYTKRKSGYTTSLSGVFKE